MPEAKIGLITDAGSCFYFNKLPFCIGLYLLMTGQKVTGESIYALGLSDYHVESEDLLKIKDEIKEEEDIERIKRIIGKY